jgi:hypothetical protein
MRSRFGALVCALLVMVGCGSDDVSDAPRVPDGADSSRAARLQAVSTTWTFVAEEWQPFTLASRATVRYGANDRWVERTLPAGRASCTNDFFGGDPLFGVVKSCEVLEDGVGPTAPASPGDGWVFVADEWQPFSLPTPGRVRYGSGLAWTLRDLPAGTASCANLFFGTDPLPGTVKRCEVLAAGAAQQGSADDCGAAMSLAATPVNAVNVKDAGAVGDGVRDDTAALQRALDALRPGQWLVFPPGVYVHSASLAVRSADVVIDGRGATLHASNPFDQALLVQASGVRVHGFVMTAVTGTRQSAAWQSRIAVWRHGGVSLAPL